MTASRFQRWLPFGIFLGLVAGVIVGADRGTLHAMLGWVNSYPYFDKVGHVVLIGTLAFLLDHALVGRTVWRLQLGGLLVAAAMTLEEISQAWMPTRTFDLVDLAANYTGVLLAEIAWRLARRRG